MAFRITFFKLPKPRPFHYRPIYYDPIKERIEEAHGRARIEKESVAQMETVTSVGRAYMPGSVIREGFQRARDTKERNNKNSSTIRIILFATLIIIFIFFYYFTDGMSMLFNALSR
jgi:hypothetical protein